jgi:hypothetical protein
MGVSAAYMSIDEQTLDRLVSLSPEVLVSTLEELEADGAPTTRIAKMWDGLHFLLTGVSADAPREDDPLSEAIVGVHVFGGEDFVGCTEHDELPAIMGALDSVDLDAVLASADFAAFGTAGIYPRIWSGDAEQLRAELAEAFAAVRTAHQRAADDGHHLLISIF